MVFGVSTEYTYKFFENNRRRNYTLNCELCLALIVFKATYYYILF